VQEKLESIKDWEQVQQEQSLHELITKIEQICEGFDDHKQEIFSLVHALKMLFLYTQGEKEGFNKYSCNFKSLWDMAEAFGGFPGVHKGLVDAVLKKKLTDLTKANKKEQANAEAEASKAVKAVLLISKAHKARYGQLKGQLANNYLLGTDQYPNTLEKATKILGNYQVAKVPHFRDCKREAGGLAFIQKGGRAGQGHGATKPAGNARQGSGGQAVGAGDAGGGSGESPGAGATKTNSTGESHCYHCGEEGHWPRECSALTAEQQEQLHMVVENEEDKQDAKVGHQFFQWSMAQADKLPDSRTYLDGCLTVTAFKSRKYLENLRSVEHGIKINCNSGAMRTNQMGSMGA
jgi:hypothetical protein